IVVLDLPGTYSLSPQSLDEQISRDVLFHRLPEVPPPDLVVVVIDASNLQRNLYFATQVVELGYPTLIALNMIDVAEEHGHHIDAPRLSKSLGVPVFQITASTGKGVPELRNAVNGVVLRPVEKTSHQSSPEGNGLPPSFCELPAPIKEATATLAELLQSSFPN